MTVHVADDVWGPLPDWGTTESIRIVGTSDPARARTALGRVAKRFMLVSEEGRELSEDELEESEGERYTPNGAYVLDQEPPALRVDCKGDVFPEMRAAFIRILLEELERQGLENGAVEPLDAP
jgi:hypothetical protein